MSSRRFGIGTKGALAAALAAVGILAGCTPKPPATIQGNIDAANAKCADGEFDAAATALAAAQTELDTFTSANEGVDVSALTSAITEADGKIKAAKQGDADRIAAEKAAEIKTLCDAVQAEIDKGRGSVADAKTALAALVAKDAGNPMIAGFQAAIEKLEEPIGPTRPQQQAEALRKLRSAIRSGDIPSAKRALAVATGLGARVATESRQIQTMDTIASLKLRVARATTETALKSLDRQVTSALRGYPGYPAGTRLQSDIRRKIAGLKKDDRPFKAAMADGKRFEGNRRTLRQAEDKYKLALREAFDFRMRSEANRAISRVRQLRDVDTLLNEGQRALGSRAYREAQSKFTAAQGKIRYISPAPAWVRTEASGLTAKINSAKTGLAKQLETEGDNTADLEKRLQKYLDAERVIRSTAIAAKIAAVRAQIEASKVGNKMAFFTAEAKAGRFVGIARDLEAAAKMGVAGAAELFKAGPIKTETVKLETAAKAGFAKTRTAVASLMKAKRYTDARNRWVALKGTLSGLEYTKTGKTIDKTITGLVDKINAGEVTRVKTQAAKITNDASKIAYLEGQLPKFPEGSAGYRTVTGLLTAAKNKKAATAFARDNKAIKDPKLKGAAKIARIQTAISNPDYEGTKYKTTLENLLKKENDAKCKVPCGKVDAKAKTLKGQAKITYLEGQIPSFPGTSYVDKWQGQITKEKDALAAGAFATAKKNSVKARDKVAFWQGQRTNPKFAGTKYEKIIKDTITKEEAAVQAGRFKAATARIRKATTSAAKIRAIQAEIPGFDGKNKETLQGMLEKEQEKGKAADFAKIKKDAAAAKTYELKISHYRAGLSKLGGIKKYADQLNALIQKAQDARLAKQYATLTARIRKFTKPEQRIQAYQDARPAYANSKKYAGLIDKAISKDNTTLKKGQYTKLKQDAAKCKTLQEKLDLYQGRAGAFTNTTFAKSIDAEIKKLKKQIEAAAKKPAPKKPAPKKPAPKKPAPKKPAVDKKKEAAAKKVVADVIKTLNKKATTKAHFDANIAKLQDAKLKVAGTKSVAAIDKQIKAQETKKKKAKK